MIKTNAMRILDKSNIHYKTYSYDSSKTISGVEVAQYLKQNPDYVFKTLVTVAKSKNHYVFLVPVAKELDLKKAAVSAGEKSVEMLKQKDLFNLTGYIHGGCSPLGMKKLFKTVIDISAQQQPVIIFSAGKIGYQIETTVSELQKVISFSLADIVI
ncbi:Cys-tRNA(Pro) deacylase [Candidatus Ruminimicrobium bovinum]|uniref:Cys-tRNA(Pro) deacylase n=1 Tax=Candidatus Ruminimicrobium bovinum TaxID=3242779 RepID=UPI0039B8624E